MIGRICRRCGKSFQIPPKEARRGRGIYCSKMCFGADRFMDHVEHKASGCWEWTGCKTAQGYGRYRDGNRITKAHRASYERFRGPIADGLFVCHSCDNPGCVNPDHLWLGTHQDNMDDMAAKGRAGRERESKIGERNPSAKLDEAAVIQIRRLRGRFTQRALGERFGVSQQMICRIQKRKNWA